MQALALGQSSPHATTAFQYRNVSDVDLKFICIATPPWPEEAEASYVEGIWQPTV